MQIDELATPSTGQAPSGQEGSGYIFDETFKVKKGGRVIDVVRTQERIGEAFNSNQASQSAEETSDFELDLDPDDGSILDYDGPILDIDPGEP